MYDRDFNFTSPEAATWRQDEQLSSLLKSGPIGPPTSSPKYRHLAWAPFSQRGCKAHSPRFPRERDDQCSWVVVNSCKLFISNIIFERPIDREKYWISLILGPMHSRHTDDGSGRPCRSSIDKISDNGHHLPQVPDQNKPSRDLNGAPQDAEGKVQGDDETLQSHVPCSAGEAPFASITRGPSRRNVDLRVAKIHRAIELGKRGSLRFQQAAIRPRILENTDRPPAPSCTNHFRSGTHGDQSNAVSIVSDPQTTTSFPTSILSHTTTASKSKASQPQRNARRSCFEQSSNLSESSQSDCDASNCVPSAKE